MFDHGYPDLRHSFHHATKLSTEFKSRIEALGRVSITHRTLSKVSIAARNFGRIDLYYFDETIYQSWAKDGSSSEILLSTVVRPCQSSSQTNYSSLVEIEPLKLR